MSEAKTNLTFQVQILHPLSIQSLSQWRKYIVPRTFPVQKIGKYHPFNQGIYFERVWTVGTDSYHAF